MTVYSSGFFSTSPACAGDNTMHGLGLTLPSPMLNAMRRCPPLAGLGIYIDPVDLEEWEGMTPSPSPEQAYPSPDPTYVSVLAQGEANVGLGIDVPQLKAVVLSSGCRDD